MCFILRYLKGIVKSEVIISSGSEWSGSILTISSEMQRSRRRYVSQYGFSSRGSHGRAVMRLFPVTFLASDSNARASIESYEWPSRRRGYTVVDLLTSLSAATAAVVLRPCDRYVTDWHTTQPTPTEKRPMYAPLSRRICRIALRVVRLVSRSRRSVEGPSVFHLDRARFRRRVVSLDIFVEFLCFAIFDTLDTCGTSSRETFANRIARNLSRERCINYLETYLLTGQMFFF